VSLPIDPTLTTPPPDAAADVPAAEERVHPPPPERGPGTVSDHPPAPPGGRPHTVTDGSDSQLRPTAPPGVNAPPGYAVYKELGRGGMGVVYLARQEGLNRPVALKMILGGAADPGVVIRFLAEADAVAAVKHPNVVQVYAYGDHDGLPYMALEFCPGGTLTELIRADRPDPGTAARLLRSVAAGVAAAHDQGIVHRDLKPGNVFFGEGGEPKVADFGLAKRGLGQDLTHTGAVMGTPAYMSPEQARGDTKFVGPEADVWALGVMLYELLAGVRPFAGNDTWDILRSVIEAAPKGVQKVAPGVPADLVLVCEKCLRPDPRDRYPTAAGVAADLGRFLAGEPVSARPVTTWERAWRWTRRNPYRTASVAAAALVFVAGGAAAVAATWASRAQAALDGQKLAERDRRGEVARRAAELYRVAEGGAAEAAKLPRGDGRAVEAWTAVERDAATAERLLAAEPLLADFALTPMTRALAERARGQLASAHTWKEARDKLDRLTDRHEDAIFAGADFPGVDAPDALARVRAAAAAGLADFGVSPTGDGPPVTDPRLYTPDQVRLILDRCYELLVFEAEALVRLGNDAREAVARLDRADRMLGAGGPARAGLRVRAVALAAAGDGAGVERVRAALDATPPRLAADHFSDALDRVRRDDSVRAMDPVNSALRMHSDHPGAEYLLAVCRLKAGEPSAARAVLTQLIDRRPTLAWPRLLRGFAEIELKHWDDARADFDAVLAAPPDPVAAYVARVNRGAYHIRRRDWDAATGDLRAAVAARPDAPAAYQNLAFAERERSEIPGWFQESMALAPGGVVDLAVAEVAQRDGRRKAVAVLDEAIRRCPADAVFYHERGRLRVLLGEFGPARADFARAVALGGKTATEDQIELGRLLERDGDPAAAVRAYRAAAGPAHPLPWRLMARPLMALGHYKEAAEALDHYMAVAPVGGSRADFSAPLADALRAKGLTADEEARAEHARGVLHTRESNLRAALDAYTRSLGLVRDPETLTLRGWTYLALDAPGLAQADFDEAVKARPASADALLGRANARVRAGLVREAVADAEAGLAAAPPEPRKLYLAARVHALAAPWFVSPVGGRGDAAAAGKSVRRAAGLLEHALEATPAAERGRFWAKYVTADRSFDGVRSGGPMAALHAKYKTPDN
jgi:tetratricopeptide (TPR) repeat protein